MGFEEAVEAHPQIALGGFAVFAVALFVVEKRVADTGIGINLVIQVRRRKRHFQLADVLGWDLVVQFAVHREGRRVGALHDRQWILGFKAFRQVDGAADYHTCVECAFAGEHVKRPRDPSTDRPNAFVRQRAFEFLGAFDHAIHVFGQLVAADVFKGHRRGRQVRDLHHETGVGDGLGAVHDRRVVVETLWYEHDTGFDLAFAWINQHVATLSRGYDNPSVPKDKEIQVIHGDARSELPNLEAFGARLVYLDPPFFTGRTQRKRSDGPSYGDSWLDLDAYLGFLRELVLASSRCMAEGAVMALHLDWRVSHNARMILDEVFGRDGFLNEIVWFYRTGGTSKRHLSRKHDTILVYANGPDYVFNVVKEKSYLAHKYGFSNIEIHQDERGPFTWTALRDVWEIPALRGNQPESTGYPTQKPLALLRRLIECFTNEGDGVLDPCCGSGTTLVAARDLGRRAMGLDASQDAVKVARGRLFG